MLKLKEKLTLSCTVAGLDLLQSLPSDNCILHQQKRNLFIIWQVHAAKKVFVFRIGPRETYVLKSMCMADYKQVGLCHFKQWLYLLFLIISLCPLSGFEW